jgi:hypothetical protein
MRGLLDGASDPDIASIAISVPTSNSGWESVDLHVYLPIAVRRHRRLAADANCRQSKR